MHTRMRTLPLLALLSVVLVSAAGVFAASNAGTVHAVTSTELGTKIVVDSGGYTLYHLTSEKKGSIGCTGACRKLWPPLLVTGTTKPVAGAGLLAAKLGTIKRPDGGVQVTYYGSALYLYSHDTKAGEVNGQGVEGAWYAITPAGSVTKATAKAVATTATTPATATAAGTSSSAAGTTPAAGNAATTTNADGCPAGTTIPQNAGGDSDDDNNGGGSDGDGCI